MNSPQIDNIMQIGSYDPPNDRLISESAKYAQTLSGACHHNPPIWSHIMADKPKKLLDQVRDKLRLKNYSYATEKTYIGWIRRYILFHQKRHPAEMGKAEIEAFLTYLAVDGNVAPSTQNQALHALLFLYRDVLEQPIAGNVEALQARVASATTDCSDCGGDAACAHPSGGRLPPDRAAALRQRATRTRVPVAARQGHRLCSPGDHRAQRQRRQGSSDDAAGKDNSRTGAASGAGAGAART